MKNNNEMIDRTNLHTFIKDLDFWIQQLNSEIYTEIEAKYPDCFYDMPNFYQGMDFYAGEWHLERYEMKDEYKPLYFFDNYKCDICNSYYETDMGNPKNIIKTSTYTFLQNEDEEWLVVYTNKEVKIQRKLEDIK